MERDLKTGRFLPGNKVAVGNRGNTKPKWGNRNALKHGLYSCPPFLPMVSRCERFLTIYITVHNRVVFKPGEWERLENGTFAIYGEKAKFLESIGMELSDAP